MYITKEEVKQLMRSARADAIARGADPEDAVAGLIATLASSSSGNNGGDQRGYNPPPGQPRARETVNPSVTSDDLRERNPYTGRSRYMGCGGGGGCGSSTGSSLGGLGTCGGGFRMTGCG